MSDYQGARGPLEYLARFGGVVAGTRSAGYRSVRRMVFIVVNTEASTRSLEDRSVDVPGPVRAALALADNPINRNSSTALSQKRAILDSRRAEVRQAQPRGDAGVFARDAEFYLAEVRLADEPDPALRQRLLALPTTLELPSADVMALRQHAAPVLRRSSEFQRLQQDFRD